MFNNQDNRDYFNKVTIKRTKRKKTISIAIKDDSIILLAPKLVDTKYLYNILIEKKEWINRKLCEQRKKMSKDIFASKTILKFGKKKNIIFRKSLIEKVLEKDEVIEIYSSSMFNINKKIENWLKRELEQFINGKLKYFKKIMNIDFKTFCIKSYKRRLGSCSYDKKLTFNWRIVMLPTKTIEYIIVHELCHLIHFNHSKEFWTLVENFSPDFREHKLLIKRNKDLFI